MDDYLEIAQNTALINKKRDCPKGQPLQLLLKKNKYKKRIASFVASKLN